MKKYLNFLTILFVSIVPIFMITGCEKEKNVPQLDPANQVTYEQILTMGEEKSTIDNIGIPYMDYDIYGDIKQPQDVPVSIGISPVPRYLPKDHPDFWRLYKIVSSKEVRFYKITYIDKYIGEELGLPIVDIKEISEEEQVRLQEEYQSGLVEDSEISTRSVTSITMTQATSFFTSMKNLNCPVLLSNPCIPFQYAPDGCYARAHYMRLHFQSTFGGDCEKIFVWRATSTKLKATTMVGCCQYWDWHVAPLVTVGSQKYVIDPGLFNGPVLASA